MNRTRLTALSLAFSASAFALFPQTAHGDNPDWTQYAQSFNITFPGYVGSTTLTDFPVLVRLSPQRNNFDYSKCKVPDGGDLRFSLPDGTLLQSEVDTWVQNGESLVWVKVPQFNRQAKIVAHYGCSSPAEVTPTNVWSADYVGVWHLNESGTPMAESSGVSTPFSTAGGSGIVYGAAGAIGGAVDFSEGTGSARLNAEEDADLAGFMDLTIEVWTWQESAKSNVEAYLLSRRKANAEASYTLYCNKGSNAGKMIFSASVASGLPAVLLGSGKNILPEYGEWCHQAFVRDASGTANAHAYKDGISVASGALNATEAQSPIYDCQSGLYLGNSHGGAGQPFNGLVDELRISRVARSGDWLQASHDTVAKIDFAAYSAGRNDDWKSYSHKFSITFENAFADATTLQNFPVLVKVSTNGVPGFLYTDCLQPKGGDLRFADEGGNLLQSEVDTWDTNGVSLVWVKIPQLSKDTKITAYYGCVLPGEVTPSKVWSEGYVGVWHLGESTLPLKESSGVSTPFNFSYNSKETLGVDGKVGGAVDFSAGDSNSRLWAADDDDLDGFTNCTFEVWTKQDAEPTRLSGILTKRQTSQIDFAYYIYNNYNTTEPAKHGRNIFIVTTDGATYSYALGSGNNMVPVWGEWCHQAFVRDVSGTQKAYGYVNGTTKKTGAAQSGAIHASAEPLYLGNSNGGTAAFTGLIDELRISNVARSQTWLQASHDTVAKADFASYGPATENIRCTILIFR